MIRRFAQRGERTADQGIRISFATLALIARYTIARKYAYRKLSAKLTTLQ